MKYERQKRILEIINNFDIKTQGEITEMLRREGFKVTQATVSRDLKDLKLTKNNTGVGRNKYIATSAHYDVSAVTFNKAIVGTIMSVKYAYNNVVIKTLPGMAQAVASAVDALNIDAILGCVAGDDTIIVVTKEIDDAARLSDEIKEILKAV